jgi:prepilin-type processing-associated H-X9-DG protein
MKIADLKSFVVFAPRLKGPQDQDKFGFVLTFNKAFDKDALAKAAKELFPKGAKLNVTAPSDRVAVVLLGLGDEFAKPQPADADGHLTPAIKAAAGGKHVLVAGATLGNLPDEIQQDDLPAQIRPFQPILKSNAVYATIDLGKSLALNIHVKAKRPAQAADAEKALAALAKLIADEAAGGVTELKADAKTNSGLADLVKVLDATLAAAKGAKFDLDGKEARATVTLPLAGLPLASAYKAATAKVIEATAANQSANNLKQIAIAMHNYASANNENFPPAAVVGKKGKPQLSWRVLILPYIEQDDLYKQFKLDEPWDSDNNKKLIAKMPKVYAIPGKTAPGGTDTHYRVFVGNGAMWDWVTGTKITNIADGTSNTLMVVTAADAVPWTKPDDLEFDPEKDMTKLLGLVVNGRAQVAMCDGSVRTLKAIPKKDTLNALITKNGGEVIGNDF